MALQTKVQKAINALKRPFMAYAADFGKLAETRAELAPKFMRAYGLFQSDEDGGSFVDFVRQIDPAVPADRDAYRVNKSYMAADYLRRLRRKDKGENRAKPVRSNLAAMARLLATLQALTNDPDRLWSGVQTEFSLTPRQVTKLRQVVAVSQPLIRIPNIRPVRVQIVHVDQEAQQAAIQATRQATRRSAAA